jgi:succinate dehydrogenase / fumarate reductase, cytochrome b subunit
MQTGGTREVRKSVTRRVLERTLKGEYLGIEAYAWAAQRITGIVLIAFLLIHLNTLSSISGGEAAYNETMKSLDNPLVKIGELFLILIVFFHSLNGIRLIMYNLFPSINHKRLVYSASIITLLLFLISIPFIV